MKANRNHAMAAQLRVHLSPLGRTGLHRSILGGVVMAVLASALPCWAQLPPGATVTQVSQPFPQRWPRLNDNREIVYAGPPGGGAEGHVVYHYHDGVITPLSDWQWNHVSPTINNAGVVAWMQGLWDLNYDVVVYVDGITYPVTDTPQPEAMCDINDMGEMVWMRYTCWPESSYNCSDIFYYDGNDAQQLTFGGFLRQNQEPRINNFGDIVWLEIDMTFGIYNSSRRVMRYSDGKVTALTARETDFWKPLQNNVGQVIWNAERPSPRGAIYLWDDGVTVEVIPVGQAVGVNDRGEITFVTTGGGTGVAWLYRDGVYYQPFDGRANTGPRDINERGNVVGSGPGVVERDIFLMFIEPIPGDYDEDGDVDLADTAALPGCLVGPSGGIPGDACGAFDFDTDNDVDIGDIAMAQRAYTGDCALAITTPPHGSGACVGDMVDLSIDVIGNVASYQWRIEDADIPGATDPTLTFGPVTTDDSALYGVELTSECGWEVRSDRRYWLKVHPFAPIIEDQPESQSACDGQDVRFCALPDIAYEDTYDYVTFQWQKDGVDIPDVDWWCLILRDVDESDVGEYRCIVSNACGTTLSQPATLTLTPPGALPEIIAQPMDQSVGYGQQAAFHVTAACADSYQWRLNGVELPGETLAELFIFPAVCEDEGTYTVEVSNDSGSVTSDPATLTVFGCG